LLPLLPPERHRELRLVATAMAIAEREAIAGDAPLEGILEQLAEFYGDSESGPPASRPHGGSLLRQLVSDLRAGRFDACVNRWEAARAILWRSTMMKLREGNPHFLAENGFGE
jgi:hypothetical protein